MTFYKHIHHVQMYKRIEKKSQSHKHTPVGSDSLLMHSDTQTQTLPCPFSHRDQQGARTTGMFTSRWEAPRKILDRDFLEAKPLQDEPGCGMQHQYQH